VKWQDPFLHIVLSADGAGQGRKALPCVPALFVAGKGRHERLCPEKPAGSGIGRAILKMAQRGVLRAQSPERGMYLAFQRGNFLHSRTKSFFPCTGNFFEKRKKLDYEGILGYTSFNFESGG